MGTPEPHPVRIGSAEREQAVQALGEHFSQGRLEPHEFEERMTAAYAARTAADLDSLFQDLPGPAGPPSRPAGPYPTPTAPYPTPTAQYPTPTAPYPPDHRSATAHPPVPPHGGAFPYPAPGHDPQAPHGREPRTGLPYSDRSKVVAGVLQLVLPFGVGRFYSGHIGIGVAQLVLSLFGVGVLWAFLDGILILAGRPTDPYGRPLHP